MRENIDLHPSSQLILRYFDPLNIRSLLVVGYPIDTFCQIIRSKLTKQSVNARISTFSFDYPVYHALHNKFIEAGYLEEDLHFGSFYTQGYGKHDMAIVYLPKSRALVEYTLTMVANALSESSKMLLVGENKAGIRSFRETIENIVGPINSMNAARHCVLYNASISHSNKLNEQKISDNRSTSPVENPAIIHLSSKFNSWITIYPLAVRGVSISIASLPGVFSHGHLDDGTRLLMESMDISSATHLLDFGCGAGVIGAFVKKTKRDCLVEMVDSNALALEATRWTMKINYLSEQGIYPSDIFSDVQGKFSHIISNPPFHRGVETDYHTVQTLITGAVDHLETGGSLWIVTNRFMKYPKILADHFGNYRVVAEDQKYCVYTAIKT
jgi:16S rRNA (guanine1207-N2)-methyltransferase